MRKMFWVVVTICLYLMLPADASAQCDPGGWDGYNESRDGVFRLGAYTGRGNCTVIEVAVWVDALPYGFSCGMGSWPDNDTCYNWYEGTSWSGVNARIAGPSCGATYGHGFHAWWVGSSLRGDLGWNLYMTNNCYTPPPGCSEVNMYYDEELEEWFCFTPIVIATGRDQRYALTSAADGVWFDANGDGIKEKISWTRAGDTTALLFIDRNGDGRVNNGKELIGNFTVPGAANGFLALMELAFQSEGVRRGDISAEDGLFKSLMLWTDLNHNGESEPNEIKPFGDQFSAIGLAYNEIGRRDQHGNSYAFQGYVLDRTKPGVNRTESGRDSATRHRKVYDVTLVRE